MDRKADMWWRLLNMGVSEETLQVVTDINGYTEDTMRDILYVVFGYRDFDQLDDWDDGDDDDWEE